MQKLWGKKRLRSALDNAPLTLVPSQALHGWFISVLRYDHI